MYRRINGFTLIEILIALVIFSVLAVITSSVLYNTFNSRERITQHSERLAKLQISMLLMQRDFLQSSNRPVTIAQASQPAFLGKADSVQFTSGGYLNPLASQRSSLMRIAYILQNQNLVRRTWKVLDATQLPTADEKIILSGIDSLSFQYLDPHLHLAPNTQALPVAVQVNLQLHNWGKMSLLFAVPIGEAANANTTLF